MNTDLFKSIALNIDTYKKLRELSNDQFEMPQSMAKTASFYIQQAHKDFVIKNEKNAKRKA